MKTITIADEEFLPYGKTTALGGDNAQINPTFFQWVKASQYEARFVTDRHIREARGERQIAWLLEPYFLHPENYHYARNKNFDAVLTHNRYFADNLGWIWVPRGGSWIDFNAWKMYPKSKNVSLIVSDKNSTRGHRLRHEVLKEFGSLIDGVYGVGEFTRKFDCLADYRFSIVIENESCPGFFTEKLLDCFAVGTIPIYWGDPNVSRTFHGNGIVSFDRLGVLEETLRLIRNDGQHVYQAKKEYVDYNFGAAGYYAVAEDWLVKEHPELFESYL